MSLINSTASSRLWFCPIKGLDPTRPPIVLLCFGSLIQVYISSQCLTPYVYDSTKELAWGISQGKSWQCALSLRRRMREENKVSCETEAGEWTIPFAWHLNPKLDSPFYYISKAKIFCSVWTYVGIAKWRFKSEKVPQHQPFAQLLLEIAPNHLNTSSKYKYWPRAFPGFV